MHDDAELLRWWLLPLATAATVIALVGVQRTDAARLRGECDRLRRAAVDLAALRAENLRLRALQPGSETLGRLRSDHEAIPRLQAELDALKSRRQPAR